MGSLSGGFPLTPPFSLAFSHPHPPPLRRSAVAAVPETAFWVGEGEGRRGDGGVGGGKGSCVRTGSRGGVRERWMGTINLALPFREGHCRHSNVVSGCKGLVRAREARAAFLDPRLVSGEFKPPNDVTAPPKNRLLHGHGEPAVSLVSSTALRFMPAPTMVDSNRGWGRGLQRTQKLRSLPLRIQSYKRLSISF